nr:MAG TPA: hypothetical protein [Herelleviridae sp.]
MPNYKPELQKLYHELEVNDTWTKEAVTDIFDKMNETVKSPKKPEQESKADYVLRHLKAGDKLSVCNMPYFYNLTPVVSVVDVEGNSDLFTLDCVSTKTAETYDFEKPLNQPKSIAVTGYHTTNLSYVVCIWADLEDNSTHIKSIKALLENGATVDYPLLFSDLDKVIGVYCDAPTQQVEALFFEANKAHRYYGLKKYTYPLSYPVYKVRQEFLKKVKDYPDMDVLLQFPDNTSSVPIWISQKERQKYYGNN